MRHNHKHLFRRPLLLFLITAFGLSVIVGAQTPPASQNAPTKRPNIVLVILDDAGFSDFGSYGSEIATPNIDQLARTGVRLTNFHAASTCEPTRAMLLSGVDSHRAGAGALQVLIANNQKGKPGYEGYLSEKAHSLGQLLRDGGYATYFAGKWNQGNGLERAPGARGWDRYLALEQTGADNFEARTYAPFNLEAVWWENGKRAQLPADFYSTKTYVDRLIEYIEEGRASSKPFMAMLALQAPHTPLQAPAADIEKYVGRYDAGWTRIRAERYRRQVELGIMPAGLTLPRLPAALGVPHILNNDWERLSADERRQSARKMAVYAAMIDNADQHIGRLREHLRRAGDLDNTVFVVMSDNGADAVDFERLNPAFRLWYRVNFASGENAIGGRRSFTHYGPHWAEVSNTPFSLIKTTVGEGGMRVPFIISYPARVRQGVTGNAFAYVTDVLPTLLDLAGVPMPGDVYQGKQMYRPTGKNMMPYLQGEAPRIHLPEAAIGFEGTGGQALFRDHYKLMRQGAPLDGRWHLFDLQSDPTESRDLSAEQPALVQEMLAEVSRYNETNGVILPEPGYDARRQILVNNAGVLLRQLGPILIAILTALALTWLLLRAGWRRWRDTQLPL